VASVFAILRYCLAEVEYSKGVGIDCRPSSIIENCKAVFNKNVGNIGGFKINTIKVTFYRTVGGDLRIF
jgi:hypothetical protein